MTLRRNSSMNGTKATAVRPAGHERTYSTPMAPPFMVSAPGKVIVFGEHAVVHGKAAMAAAISLRSYLHITTLSKSHRTIRLCFPDIGLEHTWNIDELPWDVFTKTSRKPRYYDMVTSLNETLVQAIQPFVEEVSPSESPEKRKIHQAAASAFMYLFLSLSQSTTPAAIWVLRSTLPIGAGLGSSASISVCMAAALLKQIHVLSGPHYDQPDEEVEMQLERINRWAFVGELCIHGNPSGVDNTVSTRGRAVLFKRVDYTKPPQATPLNSFPELPLLLVNTKQARSTAVEVAKVGARKKKYPDVVNSTLDGIDRVTMSAYKLISADDFDPQSETNIEHLGDLFQMNHGLLASLGVSHPKLEKVIELVDYADIGWTKLTGAGGGGCAITLLKNQVKPEQMQNLQEQFEEEGFEEYKTTLGGDGVGILYPAVLNNGTGEKGGAEINMQKFLDAETPDDIERLAGVGTKEKRPEWKFWRLSEAD